ncbi:hypothetical protein NC651_036512 [Populus alba x Populus x berolinensis]|nr:hypothetical protein NC651_036512 [Populus alba x Populus x berolinensis]
MVPTPLHFNSLIFLRCVVTCQYHKSLSNRSNFCSVICEVPFFDLQPVNCVNMIMSSQVCACAFFFNIFF